MPFVTQGADIQENPYEANRVRTFIVTPKDMYYDEETFEGWEDFTYPAKVEDMRSMMKDLFPDVEPEVVPYTPLPDHAGHLNTPRGKILFQYDPEHTTLPQQFQARGQTADCVVPVAAARLFVMDNPVPVYADIW